MAVGTPALAAAPADVTVTASSTASGTDAASAWRNGTSTPAPARSAPAGVGTTAAPAAGKPFTAATVSSAWRSGGAIRGQWIQVAFATPRPVDRIRIDGAGGVKSAFRSALVTFDDGSAVMVQADSKGNVLVDIPPRTTTGARISFVDASSGATSIGVRALSLDDAGSFDTTAATPAPSTSSNTAAASALSDGDVATDRLGATWTPSSRAAWVAQTWSRPQAISSAYIAGIPGASSSGGGRLVFSDGSSVVVSGLGRGDHPITRLAFPARIATWVRLEIADTAAGVGEFQLFRAGTTPPRTDATTGYTVSPQAATACDRSSTAVSTAPATRLGLVCPAIGTTVGGAFQVVVAGPVGVALTAVATKDAAAQPATTTATVDADGRAVLSFDAAQIPTGPFAIRISSPGLTSLYAQMINAAGIPRAAPTTAPAGLTLAFSDDFTSPLDLTHYGQGSLYAAEKPAADGSSEFGDAYFVDPAQGYQTLATTDGALRVRVAPLAAGADPYGWGRTHVGGILSTGHDDGSGVAVQYGYIEARMLAPAGRGTWPAFWALDTESTVRAGQGTGEVDVVELYGHDTTGGCHTLHSWPAAGQPAPPETTDPYCYAVAGVDDWALEWHTYAARIKPQGVDFFIDGVKVGSRGYLYRDSLPYFLLVNLSLGGGWPLDLTPTGDVADLYVDWIRVYS